MSQGSANISVQTGGDSVVLVWNSRNEVDLVTELGQRTRINLAVGPYPADWDTGVDYDGPALAQDVLGGMALRLYAQTAFVKLESGYAVIRGELITEKIWRQPPSVDELLPLLVPIIERQLKPGYAW